MIHIEDPEIPPGFRFRIRIQPLQLRRINPNPAIEISKQTKRFKRKLAKLRRRRSELFPHNPFQYAFTLASYKANILVLEHHLQKLKHFIA